MQNCTKDLQHFELENESEFHPLTSIGSNNHRPLGSSGMNYKHLGLKMVTFFAGLVMLVLASFHLPAVLVGGETDAVGGELIVVALHHAILVEIRPFGFSSMTIDLITMINDFLFLSLPYQIQMGNKKK